MIILHRDAMKKISGEANRGFGAMASAYDGDLGALPKLLGAMAPAPYRVPHELFSDDALYVDCTCRPDDM